MIVEYCHNNTYDVAVLNYDVTIGHCEGTMPLCGVTNGHCDNTKAASYYNATMSQ